MMKKTLVLAVLIMLVGFAPTWAAENAADSPTRVVSANVIAQGVEAVFDAMGSGQSDPKARVRFLPANVESWYARWYILDNAKKSIDTTYFIVEQDIFGMSMLGMLMKKAREGVNIRIMVDARGTKGLSRKFLGQDVLQEMAKLKNVQIRVFNPVSTALLSAFEDIRNVTASNHDKILLVDERFLITGGRNISKNYFVDPSDIPTVYRDTDVVIDSGMVAQQAKQAFDEEFTGAGNFKIDKDLLGDIDDMHRHLDIAYQAMRRWMLGSGVTKIDPAKVSKDTAKLLETYNEELQQYKKLTAYASFRLFQGERQYPTKILDKHSIRGFKNDITPNILALMDAAKKEIIIQNPYVVLTPYCEAALQRANDRGVKIIIHTNSPMSSDSLLTQAMFVGDWKKILAKMPNCEIHAYKLTNKLHSKVFVFDRKVAGIGTYNMDYVSEQINSEEIAVVKSPAFAGQVAHRIYEDIKNSFQYKVKVGTDGTVETVFGPETHSDAKVMQRLQWLLKLRWLRPLI